MQEEDWINAAIGTVNLGSLHAVLGELVEAAEITRRAVEYTDLGGETVQRMVRWADHAFRLMQLGELDRARKLFEQAERMQAEIALDCEILYSIRGYRFCELLLALGEPSKVLRRASRTLPWAEQERRLLDIAHDHLSLGRAELALTPEDQSRAVGTIQRAVDGLRRFGHQEFLIPGLLTRAELRRREQNFPAARRNLNEAEKIIRRSGMRLFEADLALERAWLSHAEGRTDAARIDLARARDLVEAMSYGLRRPEIEKLSAALAE